MCAPPRDAYDAIEGAVDAIGAVLGAVDAIGAVLGAVDAIAAADAIDAEPPAAA